MNIVFGTNNPAKFASMERVVEGLDINLLPLTSVGFNLIEAEENGVDPMENAKEKALSYYEQIRKPVFSCDSGLYFKEVSDEEQPGVRIKRVQGKTLNDMEMMRHYMRLADQYGGRLTAFYRNSICLVIDNNTIISYDGDDLNSEEFFIVNKPHKIYREGFPLDSISVERNSRKYYYDLEHDAVAENSVANGFRNFFRRILSQKL